MSRAGQRPQAARAISTPRAHMGAWTAAPSLVKAWGRPVSGPRGGAVSQDNQATSCCPAARIAWVAGSGCAKPGAPQAAIIWPESRAWEGWGMRRRVPFSGLRRIMARQCRSGALGHSDSRAIAYGILRLSDAVGGSVFGPCGRVWAAATASFDANSAVEDQMR